MKSVILGLVVLSLTVVACGRKGDEESSAGAAGSASTTSAAAKVGSCQKLASAGKCTEYKLPDDLTTQMQKGGCEATSGTWVLSSCPADKRFASCATRSSTILYYAGVQAPGAALVVDEEFARLDCDLTSGTITLTGKATPAPSAAEPATAPPVKKQAGNAVKKK